MADFTLIHYDRPVLYVSTESLDSVPYALGNPDPALGEEAYVRGFIKRFGAKATCRVIAGRFTFGRPHYVEGHVTGPGGRSPEVSGVTVPDIPQRPKKRAVTQIRGIHDPVVWETGDAPAIPVHSQDELSALISSWRGYGETARVSNRSRDRHLECAVTGLGEDGWLVQLRRSDMLSNGWPYWRLLSREPTPGEPDQMYLPDSASEIDIGLLFAKDIHFAPTDIVRGVWPAINYRSVPANFSTKRCLHEPMAFDSVTEALAFIASSTTDSWDSELAKSVTRFFEGRTIEQAVAIHPDFLRLRVSSQSHPIRIRRDGATAIIRGLTDDLGREYRVNLPEGSAVI